jgi:hypothetical protein
MQAIPIAVGKLLNSVRPQIIDDNTTDQTSSRMLLQSYTLEQIALSPQVA